MVCVYIYTAGDRTPPLDMFSEQLNTFLFPVVFPPFINCRYFFSRNIF